MAMTSQINPRFDGDSKPVVFPVYLYETVRNWANSTPDAVEQMGVLYSLDTNREHLVFLAKHKAVGEPNPVSLSDGELEKILGILSSVNPNRSNECQAILMHSHPSAYGTLTEGDAYAIRNIARDAALRGIKLDKHVIWPHNKKPRAYESRTDAIVEIPLQARTISEAQITSNPAMDWRTARLQRGG